MRSVRFSVVDAVELTAPLSKAGIGRLDDAVIKVRQL